MVVEKTPRMWVEVKGFLLGNERDFFRVPNCNEKGFLENVERCVMYAVVN